MTRADELKRAWADRIACFAAVAVAEARIFEADVEGAATEIVAARLLRSSQWWGVDATEVSDLAYEAVARELRLVPSNRQADARQGTLVA